MTVCVCMCVLHFSFIHTHTYTTHAHCLVYEKISPILPNQNWRSSSLPTERPTTRITRAWVHYKNLGIEGTGQCRGGRESRKNEAY